MSLSLEKEQYLESIYYDPSKEGSFSSVNNLFKSVKKHGIFSISRKNIQQWLNKQEIYGLHRNARRNYPRRAVIVHSLQIQSDADLMDLRSLSAFNKGFSFVLLVIDDFSRYIWTHPLKSKSSKDVIEGFKNIYKQGWRATKLRTDKGILQLIFVR